MRRFVFGALLVVSCTAAIREAPLWKQLDCVSAIGSPDGASDEPGFAKSTWKTDFARHCVPLSEITSGGPSRDGIPPIDRPQFYAMAKADPWLKGVEPVIAVAEGGVARAYPLQILIWHEIANDTIGGRPVTVTFCPLCNTSLVFDRRVDGRELTFGTSGNLRFSDLVMWDRQTQSWWQQATGEAIVGELAGKKLARVNALVLSYEEFKRAHPNGQVLSREAADDEAREKTGSGRDYGRNPYVGYDRADSPPISSFFGGRDLDKRLQPKTRVAVLRSASPPVAYPLDDLPSPSVVNDVAGDTPFALLYRKGAASPLDKRETSGGADIGQAGLFDRRVEGRTLTFRAAADGFVDDETRTTWLVSGLAVGGPLAGTRLAPLDHEVSYWFIWSVFRPDTVVKRP